MDKKRAIFSVEAGIAYGGLFLISSVLRQALLPDFMVPVAPLMTILAPYLLAGITVVLVRRTVNRPADTIAEGALSGAVIGILQVLTLMLLSALTDYQMHGEYTSSNSGFVLIGYCCLLGSAPMALIGAILGATAAAVALIGRKIAASLKAV